MAAKKPAPAKGKKPMPKLPPMPGLPPMGKGDGMPPMKDKQSKSKAKTKAKGLKPPKPMNPGPASFPPMLGM